MNNARRTNARGAASVEAVVVLPVFVMLLLGMFWVRALTGARLGADEQVRRCSWQYALQNNCEQKPVGCDHVVGDAHYGDLVPDFEHAFDALGEEDLTSYATQGYKAVQRILQNFVMDYLGQAITKRFEAEKSVERERPRVFGGGRTVVRSKYGLACNVKGRTQDNVVEAVWNEFKP